VYLSIETLLEGFSILVFTPTKNWAEKLAETISKEVFALGAPPPQGTIKFLLFPSGYKIMLTLKERVCKHIFSFQLLAE